MAYTVVVGKI